MNLNYLFINRKQQMKYKLLNIQIRFQKKVVGEKKENKSVTNLNSIVSRNFIITYLQNTRRNNINIEYISKHSNT